MSPPVSCLVIFAVKEEADCFRPADLSLACRTALAGMGKHNAERSIRQALAGTSPDFVITAGFAGGLNPQLVLGTVVFEADEGSGWEPRLASAGAVRARFHCADHVAVTAAEKQALRQATGADAVEMESGVIRRICREKGIPSATVRVISDAAGEDLPLDFNRLMTTDYRLDFVKLAGCILRSPRKIGQLMRFQKQTQAAARSLAGVLQNCLQK